MYIIINEKIQGKNKYKKGRINILLLIFLVIAFLSVIIFSFILGYYIGNTASYSSDIFDIQSDNNNYDGLTKPETYPGTNPNITLNDEPSGENPYTSEEIYDMVSPSIVSITSYVKNSNGEYKVYYGSGIIMSEDGYILTNAHVLGNSYYSYTVMLNDDTEYNALLIAADSKSDIGIIKIENEPNNLTPAQFGDSSAATVGQQVYAIGSPSGPSLYNSISKGIISGINRNLQIDSTLNDITYIQTDASINPGNSGGALVNEYGQVIGINVAKISGSDYDGLAFSIPIDQIMSTIDDLFEYGRVMGRVKLGLYLTEVDKYTADSLNVPPGLMIQNISNDCIILHGELKSEDIVTHVDGVEVEDCYDLQKIISDKSPGDHIILTIERTKTSGRTSSSQVEIELTEDITTF